MTSEFSTHQHRQNRDPNAAVHHQPSPQNSTTSPPNHPLPRREHRDRAHRPIQSRTRVLFFFSPLFQFSSRRIFTARYDDNQSNRPAHPSIPFPCIANQQWRAERASPRAERAPAARLLASTAPRSSRVILRALVCRYVVSCNFLFRPVPIAASPHRPLITNHTPPSTDASVGDHRRLHASSSVHRRFPGWFPAPIADGCLPSSPSTRVSRVTPASSGVLCASSRRRRLGLHAAACGARAMDNPAPIQCWPWSRPGKTMRARPSRTFHRLSFRCLGC